MSKDGFDVRKLREFQEALESMKAEAPAIIEEMAVGEGVYAVKQARLICKNEKIVDTGAYRMNFHTGSKARGAWEGSEHDGSAPKKSGNTYIIDVYNNLDYAKHLEYGFRSHWVPAQYLSPRTLAEVYRHRNALAVEAGRKPLDKMPDGMYVGPKGGYVWGVFVMKRAIERTKTTQDARLSRKWNKKVQEYVEGRL